MRRRDLACGAPNQVVKIALSRVVGELMTGRELQAPKFSAGGPQNAGNMTAAAAVQRRDGSSLETCGFVLHFLSVPIAILYLAWALLPEETLHSCGMTYYPPKSWAVLVPTSLVCAFLAAPLLYAACNILSTPKVDSIDTIWDEHSREPLGQLLSDNDSIVPAICDLDVLTVNRLMDLNETNRIKNEK